MQVAAQHPLEAMRRVCDTEAAGNRATGSKTSTGGLQRSEPRTAGPQWVALPQVLISSAGMAELADAADSKSYLKSRSRLYLTEINKLIDKMLD